MVARPGARAPGKAALPQSLGPAAAGAGSESATVGVNESAAAAAAARGNPLACHRIAAAERTGPESLA